MGLSEFGLGYYMGYMVVGMDMDMVSMVGYVFMMVSKFDLGFGELLLDDVMVVRSVSV